ncbi:hypothetical protein PsYK624_076180 [Phanerochaete sordida]|uniref:Uncharacterized protein n=1 Tax=Phanerochaete sordida TaxID=48140 RepID=A0A9P3LEF8_9APHY|nr:hypothetical protein PsYK624_076180 [Phanerochaete sordida]
MPTLKFVASYSPTLDYVWAAVCSLLKAAKQLILQLIAYTPIPWAIRVFFNSSPLEHFIALVVVIPCCLAVSIAIDICEVRADWVSRERLTRVGSEPVVDEERSEVDADGAPARQG